MSTLDWTAASNEHNTGLAGRAIAYLRTHCGGETLTAILLVIYREHRKVAAL